MVQVGMREHDSVEAGRWDGKFVPVPKAQILQPLEQPAIEQNPPPVVLQKILGTCDGARRTKKCEFGHVTNDDIRVFLDLSPGVSSAQGSPTVLLCQT